MGQARRRADVPFGDGTQRCFGHFVAHDHRWYPEDIVVPVAFAITHRSSYAHPELKGKYQVTKILINEKDMTSAVDRDSVLSVIYLEVGNTAVFQFRNYKQRSMGIYDYDQKDHHFNIDWVDGKISQRLVGTLITEDEKELQLKGEIGADMLDVRLTKVK